MKLKDYLVKKPMTPATFAVEVGATGEAVRLWLKGDRIPNKDFMATIKAKTKGKVTANDFYEDENAQPQ